VVVGLEHFSPEERQKIAAAVADAQARTHARFSLVVVPASERYHLYPVVWGACIAFVAFAALALAYPVWPVRLVFAGVAGLFVVVSLLLEWRPLRLAIVPRRTKSAHARVLVHREFAARILAHKEQGGGILFFVSLAERHAEIMADRALHEAVGQAQWDRIVSMFVAAAREGRIADGFVTCAKSCGDVLAQHHPKS